MSLLPPNSRRPAATSGARSGSRSACSKSASTPATARCSRCHRARRLEYYGVDIMSHAYTAECVDFLKGEFPGRVHLFPGNSREVLPWLVNRRAELAFDIFHVDGGHTSEVCQLRHDELHSHRQRPARPASDARRRPCELDLRHLLRVRLAGRFDDRDVFRRLGGSRPQRAGQDRVSLPDCKGNVFFAHDCGPPLRRRLRIRVLLAWDAQSVRLRVPRLVSSSRRELARLQLRSAPRPASRRAPRGRERDLPRQIAHPPIHRQRQAVDRDLRRHVPLPDDPGQGLLLGRYRHPLLEQAGFRQRRRRCFAARPTRSGQASSTTRC